MYIELVLILVLPDNTLSDKTDRSIILNTNKFEMLIIYPILIFCLLAALLIYLCLEYNVRISINPSESTILNFDAVQFREAIPYMIIGIAVILICIISWSYYVANKLVGPHERIIKELNDVIQEKKTDPLTVRNDDKMFAELLERINMIIEKLYSYSGKLILLISPDNSLTFQQ